MFYIFISAPQRVTMSTIYSAQPNDGKINVSYRMPTNIKADDTASISSTTTAKMVSLMKTTF